MSTFSMTLGKIFGKNLEVESWNQIIQLFARFDFKGERPKSLLFSTIPGAQSDLNKSSASLRNQASKTRNSKKLNLKGWVIPKSLLHVLVVEPTPLEKYCI